MRVFKKFANPMVVQQYFNGMIDSLRKDSSIFLQHSRCHVYGVINGMDVTDEKKLLCKMAYDKLWREHEMKKRVDRERDIQMVLELTLYSV